MYSRENSLTVDYTNVSHPDEPVWAASLLRSAAKLVAVNLCMLFFQTG